MLRDAVLADIENMELPTGYEMEWGAEFEDTAKAQASLIPCMVPAFAVILLIIVMLFNAYKPLICGFCELFTKLICRM